MKQKIYILLAAALVALAGCIQDKQWETPPPAEAYGGVSLNIALPSPVAKNMGRTRGVRDFFDFENLNVIIAAGNDDADAVLYSFYLTFDLGTGELTSALPAGVDYDERGDDFGIHFAREWFRTYEIDPEAVKFFLVGNYYSPIDVATVGDLRNFKYFASIAGMPEGSPGYNVLYGESEDYDGDDYSHMNPDPDDVDHTGGRNLKVDLARLAAMITVKIDGSGLKGSAQDGYVEIIPHFISLHNVPKWSYVAKANKATGVDDWSATGERINVGTQVRGSIGKLKDEDGLSPMGHKAGTTFGWHYTDEEMGGTETNPNYSLGGIEKVPALFMLENIHGEGFGETEDVDSDTGLGKRPADVANDEAAIWSAAETLHCSYLEVEAEYLEYDGSGNVVKGGDITYRVFLGENLVENFDVVRNTYYRYTLMLSGTGIGEGDASWRLDTDLSDTSVLDETDFILNGAGEMMFINELTPQGNSSHMDITYVGPTYGTVKGGSPFLYLAKEGDWQEFPNASGNWNDVVDTRSDYNAAHLQFRIFAGPMAWNGGSGNEPAYMRQVTFYLHSRGTGYQSAEMTITQYAPMRIYVNPTDEKMTPEIKEQIAAAGKDPERPLTIYFDRVDRAGQPWGFEGMEIENQGTGLQNGIALLGTATGATYMQFGKPSAVMHAAYINYYQQGAGTAPMDAFTAAGQFNYNPPIAQIRTAAGNNPTNPIVPNALPSRAEWILLEMLDQADFGVFDSLHDIVPWQPYWTSDAVEESDSQSYAYRRNATSTDSFMMLNRTSPMPYRMIYIEQ